MIGHIFLTMTICFPDVIGEQIFNVQKAKSLRRDPEKGVFYAHFKSHQHHRLDVSPIKSTALQSRQECAQKCADTKPCFSFNLASKADVLGKLTCELLPSDIYAKSDKFSANDGFHHFSIKVNMFNFYWCFFLFHITRLALSVRTFRKTKQFSLLLIQHWHFNLP